MELTRDGILSKFYRHEKLTKAEINWLVEQEFDQFSEGIDPVPFEEKMYEALNRARDQSPLSLARSKKNENKRSLCYKRCSG
jgi:hypothetical protein